MIAFLTKQFWIDGYKCFRKDRNAYGGGLCLYVNENVPCKKLNAISLKYRIYSDWDQLKKTKMAYLRSIQTTQHCKNIFLENLSNQLNDTLRHYENVLLLGDFNLTPVNKSMVDFLSTHDLNNLINEPTCF